MWSMVYYIGNNQQLICIKKSNALNFNFVYVFKFKYDKGGNIYSMIKENI